MEWNVEEQKLSNMKYGIGGLVEKTPRAEKIAFVDKMQNGKMTELLNLIDKFNTEKDNLPKDSFGSVKTVSMKAFLKRNPTTLYITCYRINGEFHLLGVERSLERVNDRNMYDTYDDIVEECFYRQLKECVNTEKRWFLEHDIYSINIKKLKQNINTYGWLSDKLIISSSDGVLIETINDMERKVTLEEVQMLNEKYDMIEKYIESLKETIHLE